MDNPFLITSAKNPTSEQRATQELTCPTCKRDLGQLGNWRLCAEECDPRYSAHDAPTEIFKAFTGIPLILSPRAGRA